jgi:signal transduction histidine kinase
MSGDRQEEHLNNIQAQVNHLTALLDDILTISKAESIGLDFNPVPTDLHKLCAQAVKQIQQNTGGSHEIIFSGSPIIAVVDEKLMSQAISNLLSNAVKYSPPGSRVSLELASSGEQVILRIADEGIGIPKEDRERLFQIFHRASNVRNISGTGLGLAITRRAVEVHGGSITVESEVGEGTTFTLILPRQAEVASETSS